MLCVHVCVCVCVCVCVRVCVRVYLYFLIFLVLFAPVDGLYLLPRLAACLDNIIELITRTTAEASTFSRNARRI